MDLERQKENFKNHKATFTDYGNIKILDFKRPNSSEYRIRFLFEEDYYRLHISGDLGELIASNYKNMCFEDFCDFVNNTAYFEEKIDCMSRTLYFYDEDLAREELRAKFEEDDAWDDFMLYRFDFEDHEDVLDAILRDFDDRNGISKEGYEELEKVYPDAWEFTYDLGKKNTGILEVYMLAFKLATKQLAEMGCE